MGQQSGDVSISLNVTSPYFSFSKKPCLRSWSAIRLSSDYRIKSAIPAGATTDSLMSYFDARIGITKAEEVSRLIRIYEEIETGNESGIVVRYCHNSEIDTYNCLSDELRLFLCLKKN